MKKADTHHIDILGELLEEITPKEQKRMENRMRLAAKIADGIEAKWGSGGKGKLAEALGLKGQSLVTKWLSGTNNFTSDVLSDIQDVLGIKLLALEDKQPAKEQRDVYEKKDVVVNIFVKAPTALSMEAFGSQAYTFPLKHAVGQSYLN